jgi:hypothetical protein
MNKRATVAATVVGLLLLAPPGHAAYSMKDLVAAAKRGDAHAVHRLLEDGADVRAVDADGYTALHWAGIRGHFRIFRELLGAGAPVDAVGADGGTPLHWACHHDRADMVELLLDAGADLTVKNRWGRTALHVAARRGNAEVARLLLRRGADPNAATREGWTPLHVAYRSGNPELVTILEASGADPSRRDADGSRPSDHALVRPAEVPIDPARLADYVGLYALGEGGQVKVWRDGGRLRIREFAPDELYPIGEDRFFCRREPWPVTFLRGADGRVEAVELGFLRRTVRAERTRHPQYVGSRACRECHSTPEQGDPYVTWLHSRHSHAYWRLAGDWALFLGRQRPQYHDLESPLTDERCLLCHVTGAQDPDALFAGTFRPEEGVGCESCHGPGSDYVAPETMADHPAFLAAGGVVPDSATCQQCHRNSERFDFATWWPKVAHGRPPSHTLPGVVGDYLGQEPPGHTPRLFAPGIVSTGLLDRDIAMMPDGSEIYFGVAGPGYAFSSVMMTRRLPDGSWTEPEVASFVAPYPAHDLEAFIAPDGRRVFFLSDRVPPGAEGPAGNSDIWVADRAGDGWGEPRNLGAPVCTEDQEYFPSVTRDGTLYFTRQKRGEANFIYRSRLVGGAYTEPERLPSQVNSGRTRFNAFVAPDESYLILSVIGRPDAIGQSDYYVCFRTPDDVWSEPVNLGPAVNVPDAQGYSPYVSPDGRYFFFMSTRPTRLEELAGQRVTQEKMRELLTSPGTGNADTYWVDASFIERLRPR